MCAACEVCGSLALAFRQLLFRVWCLGAGATFAVLLFVHYLSLGLDPVPEILSAAIYRNHNTAQGAFAFAVGLHGFFSGWFSRCRARGLVAGDKKAYGELWEACCARDAGGASRAAVALAVAGLSAALPSEPVRQRCAAPPPPSCPEPASPTRCDGEEENKGPPPSASRRPSAWRSAASLYYSTASHFAASMPNLAPHSPSYPARPRASLPSPAPPTPQALSPSAPDTSLAPNGRADPGEAATGQPNEHTPTAPPPLPAVRHGLFPAASFSRWRLAPPSSSAGSRDVESEQAVGPLVATLEQVPRRRRTFLLCFFFSSAFLFQFSSGRCCVRISTQSVGSSWLWRQTCSCWWCPPAAASRCSQPP